MSEERNLYINLMNPDSMLSCDIYESNNIYDDGYIPYFARRRMDLHEGEKREIVNDIAVEFEFARLHQYGNRKCASKDHIHDLIDYMVEKNTLFVPWVNLPNEEVVTSGEDYRHANMAWEILKHYLHTIICETVHYYTKGADTPEKVMKNIEKYIYKKDLLDFIITAFKLGYDPIVAKIFATIIWGFEYHRDVGNNDLKRYFHEEVLERMVVFALVGSRPNDYSWHLSLAIHRRFPKMIAKIAANFNYLEAGMVDATYLDNETLIPYAYSIMRNGYDITVFQKQHNRFPLREDIVDFYKKAVKYLKEPITEFKFQQILALQDNYRHLVPSYEEILKLIPEDNSKGPDEVYQKNKTSLNCFVNLGSWLYVNLDYINIKHVNPGWVNEKNLMFAEALSMALTRKLSRYEEFSQDERMLTGQLIRQTLNQYANIIKRRFELAKRANPDESDEHIISNIPEMQFIIRLIQHPKHSLRLSAHVIRELYDNHDFLKIFIATLLPIYNNELKRENLDAHMVILKNESLDDLISRGAPLEVVMKNVNIYTHFEWVKKHYGTLFVELPDYIFTSRRLSKPECYTHMIEDSYGFRCLNDFGKEELEWIMSVLTEEQQCAYPFPIELMRKYRDIFEPLVDKTNIDRYIKAYGLNWVEKNIKISISDIVNAGAYVNEQVIRRYIDIILLDDELRKKMLMNKQVCEIIMGRANEFSYYDTRFHTKETLLNDILRANNFTNAIKCEVLMHLEKNGYYSYPLIPKISQYLISSGNAGRALVAMMLGKYNCYELRELDSSDIFDIQHEDKPERTPMGSTEDKIKKINKE